MSTALAEEAEKLVPGFTTSARLTSRAGKEYIDTQRALLQGKEASPEKIEKMKGTSQVFFKKKTAQDRLWRRLRKRYDDAAKAGDGDYGDDADDFNIGESDSDGEMVPAVSPQNVWQEYFDESAQAKYWYNAATGEASWVQPEVQPEPSSPSNKQQATGRDKGGATGRTSLEGQLCVFWLFVYAKLFYQFTPISIYPIYPACLSIYPSIHPSSNLLTILHPSSSGMSTGRSSLSHTRSPEAEAGMSSSRRQLRQQKILKKDPIAASLVNV